MKTMARGSEIFYQEYGSGVPVVCLHGYAADHRLSEGWLEPVFTGLEGYRRLYPDLPGMGASVPDPALNDADSMVETLTDWVEAVIGDQRFLLAGESYGGYLALGMLRARLGSRVDGLMLLCPVMMAGRAERTLPPHTHLTADKDLLSRESGKAFENFLGVVVSATPESWERYQREVLPGLQAADMAFTDRYRRKGYALRCEGQLSTLRFDKPACVALGKQDATVGYEDALPLLRNFPRVTFAVLDGGGHNLHLECEEPLNALTRDWLKRVNAERSK